MQAVRVILNLLMWLIYVFYALVVLYFPVAELLSYVGRDTRFFTYKSAISINDVILPGILAAVVYSGVAFLRRRLKSPTSELATEPENAASSK